MSHPWPPGCTSDPTTRRLQPAAALPLLRHQENDCGSTRGPSCTDHPETTGSCTHIGTHQLKTKLPEVALDLMSSRAGSNTALKDSCSHRVLLDLSCFVHLIGAATARTKQQLLTALISTCPTSDGSLLLWRQCLDHYTACTALRVLFQAAAAQRQHSLPAISRRTPTESRMPRAVNSVTD